MMKYVLYLALCVLVIESFTIVLFKPKQYFEDLVSKDIATVSPRHIFIVLVVLIISIRLIFF